MQIIENKEYGGERPLFASHHLHLVDVTIHAGESALKECSDIVCERCRFEGKYPLWHVDGFRVSNCKFAPGARAALWYSRHLVMTDTRVEAPKMFREMDDLRLERVVIPYAEETLWHCRGAVLRDVALYGADYLFLHSSDIDIERYRQHGNYSFQYCRNVEIRNANIYSKDAFWNTENVVVRDSELVGEYLGWHSRGLHLINCNISGTQPLCYAHDLVLENCTFDSDADLAFEYSTVQADIRGSITSIKNPTSGHIVADEIGELILDDNRRQPGDCKIQTRK